MPQYIPPPWLSLAKQMRSEGKSIVEIRDATGIHPSTLRWHLNEDGYQARQAKSKERSLLKSERKGQKLLVYSFVQPHQSRSTRRIIPPSNVIMDLARSFAAGEISRAELSGALRGIR